MTCQARRRQNVNIYTKSGQLCEPRAVSQELTASDEMSRDLVNVSNEIVACFPALLIEIVTKIFV